MAESKTPYVEARDGWAEWLERKIVELKIDRGIARVNKENGGLLRSNGRRYTAEHIGYEIKIFQHMLEHCHEGESCDPS